ncbi:hypothetical protein J4Q44_G00344000 [Coregonus suidteri]|uniref:Uncharacterized protein n=1 Tax=Coregonus suidteri TaxID=861788 RepID=A0AAN8Q8D0_9TELE
MILISHSNHPDDTSKAISETPGVDTMVLVADFSQGDAACKPVKDALRDKDIGFLVNCVDDCLGNSLNFTGLPEDQLWGVLNTHCCHHTDDGRGSTWHGREETWSSGEHLHHEYGHQGIFVQSGTFRSGAPWTMDYQQVAV